MTDKENFLEWLYGLRSRGIKLDLKNTSELLRRLGDPQNKTKHIHVAGTDGKGSVCACMASILRASGIRTGLYTSPHLIEFNERINVDGRDITDDELLELIDEVLPKVTDMEREGIHLTFFEVTTAMAFLYFAKMRTEYAVIEVGLGGRLDSTNVVTPEVSVICNVSMDHEEFLGDTIEKIAFEKAGIIKAGIPCVTFNSDAVMYVIYEAAEERGSAVTRIVPGDVEVTEADGHSVSFTYKGEGYTVSLPGRYQATNAVISIEALSKLSIFESRIKDNVRSGLAEVRWPCRLEKIKDLPIILDVSHTPAGTKVLSDNIAEIYGKAVVVLGVLSDKDVDHIANNLSRVACKVIATAPDADRAMSAQEVAAAMGEYIDVTAVTDNVADAMDIAMKIRGENMILVTGSFYMAGDALKWLKRTYAGY